MAPQCHRPSRGAPRWALDCQGQSGPKGPPPQLPSESSCAAGLGGPTAGRAAEGGRAEAEAARGGGGGEAERPGVPSAAPMMRSGLGRLDQPGLLPAGPWAEGEPPLQLAGASLLEQGKGTVLPGVEAPLCLLGPCRKEALLPFHLSGAKKTCPSPALVASSSWPRGVSFGQAGFPEPAPWHPWHPFSSLPHPFLHV